MKNYLAIISPNKYADFDTLAEAQAHVSVHGGFAAATPGQYSEFFVIDMGAETVTFDQAAADADLAEKLILSTITNFERQVTQRRLREAMLTDEGKAWLQNIEDQIAAERARAR
jgi:hypothetical protein